MREVKNIKNLKIAHKSLLYLSEEEIYGTDKRPNVLWRHKNTTAVWSNTATVKFLKLKLETNINVIFSLCLIIISLCWMGAPLMMSPCYPPVPLKWLSWHPTGNFAPPTDLDKPALVALFLIVINICLNLNVLLPIFWKLTYKNEHSDCLKNI